MSIKKVLSSSRYPVKVWTNDIDSKSEQQLLNIANLPFIHKHIAAMPDVHLGIGATIGSVIATKGAIIPAAVGVDLGCGMVAVQTSLTAKQLPDNLHSLRLAIEQAVPHGRSNNGGIGDTGSWGIAPRKVLDSWEVLSNEYNFIVNKHPKAKAYNTFEQLGTLGTGNHFIELCLDESNNVWIMLHSGSRGAGNKIGSYFIELAKREAEKYFITEYLADKDTAYLVEHTEIFTDYINAVSWAQTFAEINRELMLANIVEVMSKYFYKFTISNKVINCHHNYIARENHYHSNVIVTRKGAIRARLGDLGIIPGSMGAKSYIVSGKGNPEAFHSCSHGAGRCMSRSEAERLYTVQDLITQTQGIECPKDQARVDEIPSAYKDIDVVMDNQSDLVEIVHTLKQVLNIKG